MLEDSGAYVIIRFITCVLSKKQTAANQKNSPSKCRSNQVEMARAGFFETRTAHDPEPLSLVTAIDPAIHPQNIAGPPKAPSFSKLSAPSI